MGLHRVTQAGTYGSLPCWTEAASRFQSISANKLLIKTEGCMISNKRDQPLLYYLCLHGNVGADRFLTWQPSQSPWQVKVDLAVQAGMVTGSIVNSPCQGRWWTGSAVLRACVFAKKKGKEQESMSSRQLHVCSLQQQSVLVCGRLRKCFCGDMGVTDKLQIDHLFNAQLKNSSSCTEPWPVLGSWK